MKFVTKSDSGGILTYENIVIDKVIPKIRLVLAKDQAKP
jgi:hypothetical protein